MAENKKQTEHCDQWPPEGRTHPLRLVLGTCPTLAVTTAVSMLWAWARRLPSC